MKQAQLADSVEILYHTRQEKGKPCPYHVFFPGIGEAGTPGRNISVLYKHHLPFHLQSGAWNPLGVYVAVFAPSAFPTGKAVNKIIDQVLALFPEGDKDRINLHGLSAGAETVLDYILEADAYCDRIANIVCMSVTESPCRRYLNGAPEVKARLQRTRAWFIHGTIDPKPHSIAPVRAMVAECKKAGHPAIWLTERKGAGHNLPWNTISAPGWRSPNGNNIYGWCAYHARGEQKTFK